MTFEVFSHIVEQLQLIQEKNRALYKLDVDITNYTDPIHSIISHLLGVIYGQEGLDTFEWWCYEKDFGHREDLTMTNSKGDELCKTIHDLWVYLEHDALNKEEYNLPKKLTEEERLQMFKNIFENEK